jgi:hypothetical protein
LRYPDWGFRNKSDNEGTSRWKHEVGEQNGLSQILEQKKVWIKAEGATSRGLQRNKSS